MTQRFKALKAMIGEHKQLIMGIQAAFDFENLRYSFDVRGNLHEMTFLYH
jgi:hypothetical protein